MYILTIITREIGKRGTWDFLLSKVEIPSGNLLIINGCSLIYLVKMALLRISVFVLIEIVKICTISILLRAFVRV